MAKISDTSTNSDVEEQFQKIYADVLILHYIMSLTGILRKSNPRRVEISGMLNECTEMIFWSRYLISSLMHINGVVDDVRHADNHSRPPQELIMFSPLDDNCGARQKVILVCLAECARLQLRKDKDGWLYREMKTFGHKTSLEGMIQDLKQELDEDPSNLEVHNRLKEKRNEQTTQLLEVRAQIEALAGKEDDLSLTLKYDLQLKEQGLQTFDHTNLNGIGTCFWQRLDRHSSICAQSLQQRNSV